ncbi:MAG: endolytic transglycosylase MltG [Acidobacteria bacterium]|nr:endolytic transglycosylase MltG [Acidobacteriota bacterium]MCI0625385.1 endolytic transglycosylase MltG [Acidobacteriota bacterium]MCI0721028.1 endolytic transglycosylase MltG [Acidobacteriota bacterium]
MRLLSTTGAGKRTFILAVVVCLLALAGTAVALGFVWSRPFPSGSGPQKFLVLPRGTSSYEAARLLEREGIIRHGTLFLGYLKLVKPKSPLQAGEYRFEEPLSIVQVADKLIRGLIYYHELTIPEGYSLFDISNLLEQKGFTSAAEFLAAAGRVEQVVGLNISAKNLEGFLFPDTYRLARGTTPDEITHMMVRRFREVYALLEPQLSQSTLNLIEAVTLASLIEKETGVDSERELVSAVFHNRLKRKMPLQCDPTVIYAAQLKSNYRGKIFQSDLDFNSPYNTYRHPGLPPGPIANPGRRSLEAALSPAKADYLYFVADNRGGHVFSKTLAEHQRAVAAYRKGLARNAKAQAGSAGALGKL